MSFSATSIYCGQINLSQIHFQLIIALDAPTFTPKKTYTKPNL